MNVVEEFKELVTNCDQFEKIFSKTDIKKKLCMKHDQYK